MTELLKLSVLLAAALLASTASARDPGLIERCCKLRWLHLPPAFSRRRLSIEWMFSQGVFIVAPRSLGVKKCSALDRMVWNAVYLVVVGVLSDNDDDDDVDVEDDDNDDDVDVDDHNVGYNCVIGDENWILPPLIRAPPLALWPGKEAKCLTFPCYGQAIMRQNQSV
ncbi:hypothetical protein PoB_003265500 [Plakobranchus ocellatus]|uniref:Uncharacterized protein n=1 Tax=Plakobranchus ocellatus TaxID=259542 RepID=A0AAV4AHB5_9GAST|nr:hypothetical protein PoB_003265500 [Plakobranchus ocellatus]